MVPRYGPEIGGGAETLCRVVAEDLAAAGHPVEVFTTCAVNHFTWDDHHAAGTTVEGGVPVHRFPVTRPRDHGRFIELHHAIARRGRASYYEQLEWLANGVTSQRLADALDARRDEIRVRLALPYLFGTTFWCTVQDPARTVVVPCLHDEAHAHVSAVRRMLEAAVGCLANSPAEMTLIQRIAPGARASVGGVGFAVPDRPPDPRGFCAERDLAPGYLLYAGRREEGKGLGTLYRHYARYAAGRPDAPPLALMGSGEMAPPAAIADRVLDLGFVPAARKRDAMAAAALLVHPSRMESFGMVMLEAWLEGTPALVDAASPVLLDHCRRGSGGLWYAGYAEFAEALDLLLGDPALRARLGAAGRRYVIREHGWPAVRGRYLAAVEAWT